VICFLMWPYFAHSKCLVYRVRQREYYDTVGWKYSETSLLFSVLTQVSNDLRLGWKTLLETTLLFCVVTTMSEMSQMTLEFSFSKLGLVRRLRCVQVSCFSVLSQKKHQITIKQRTMVLQWMQKQQNNKISLFHLQSLSQVI
jgi:hypothetical protein